jgi:hypothetical protein
MKRRNKKMEEKICKRCGKPWNGWHVCNDEDIADRQVELAEMRMERGIARAETSYEVPEWYD